MRFLLILSLFCFIACSKKDVRSSSIPSNPAEKTEYYFTTVKNITVEVAYESGHAPYAENVTIGTDVSVWQILDENLNALYYERTPYPLIKVPKTLAEMKEIPVQNKTSWTAEDIVKLAEKHRTGQSSTSHTYFWVVFLDGYFNDGSEDIETTIGVSIGGTTVLAIFKDVVESTDTNGTGVVPKYAEQATLVHELGHSLGLVNNGLPMHGTDSHQDTVHGHHCTNPNCVMYWLVEGKKDMIQFAINFARTGQMIMFDNKCLEDARNYSK